MRLICYIKHRVAVYGAFFICVIILLAACQQEHFSSVIPVSKQWSVQDRYAASGQLKPSLPRFAWWKQFHDPQLDALVQQSLTENNTVNQSLGKVAAATGQLKKIRLQWLPNIDAITGYSQNPATGFPGFLAIFAPSYTLNIFKQLQEQTQAHHELVVAKAEDDAIRLYIISSVISAYITYLAEYEYAELIKIYLADLQHIDSITVNMKNGGLVSQIPIEVTHSSVNELQAELEQAEHNIILSRNALHYLINTNPGDFPVHHPFSHFKSFYEVPSSLPLIVLRQRPDMQQAIHELIAANAKVGVEASDLLSEMHLDLLMGPVAGQNRYTLPKYMVYFNDQRLTIPLLRPYVLGEVDKAKGLQKVAYFKYVDKLQQILQDTTNALSAHDRCTQQLKAIMGTQHHHATIYVLNQKLSHQGIQSHLETLNSKLLLDKKNMEVNRAKLRSLLTVVKLYQELGGGYRAKERDSK